MNINNNKRVSGSLSEKGLPAKFAIILCGGKGERVGYKIPKQFIEVDGVPILAFSMKAFVDCDPETQLVLVLPEEYTEYWSEVCKRLKSTSRTSGYCPDHIVVTGGKSRTESVLKGLGAVTGELSDQTPENIDVSELCDIAIHDGARPYITPEMIKDGWEKCAETKAAIPVVPMTDSIRIIEDKDGDITKAVNREMYCAVQTPQIFNLSVLTKAYSNIKEGDSFSDDAGVVEKLFPVSTYRGIPENTKVTNPRDAQLATILLKVN